MPGADRVASQTETRHSDDLHTGIIIKLERCGPTSGVKKLPLGASCDYPPSQAFSCLADIHNFGLTQTENLQISIVLE